MNITAVNEVLTSISDALYASILVALLVGVGIYLTVRTRAVQVRHFAEMLRSVAGSRRGAEGGISSFQAFAISLAARVGIGNIAGVAIALTLGGPGAIFWMWMVALVGMATAFCEAVLAQTFKVRWPDGTFRGGPAYYIRRGLRSKGMAAAFAVLCVVAMTFGVIMVQANTISGTLAGHGVTSGWSAVVLVVLTAPVILGGIRSVARVAEYLAPIMAAAYVLLMAVVLVLNLPEVPAALGQIFRGAFGLDPALAGTAGGIVAAVLNGVRRGLFSNEAGMGTAPNAAGTATVGHPVQQGLIQALGVFIDTIIICTATALLILLAGPSVYTPGVTPETAGASLTQDAVAASLGGWTAWPMTVIIFVFAYSSILGAYTYAQVNLDYLGGRGRVQKTWELVTVAAVGLGAVLTLTTVWSMSDIFTGLMTVLNLVALVMLVPWVAAVLRDYERQRVGVRTAPTAPAVEDGPHFRSDAAPLPAELPGEVWATASRR
ncbi:alanine/glycine:cation symporter family protein [Georgenia sp. AZ-5]|uniref:alanine/glycine:cation symporter family protein n=1 Tax=Georgenia sp. AZ-5 TaxID=3367526 RepID=UPI0037545D78